MKRLALAAAVLAALAAAACRKPIKAEAPPDWGGARERSERAHGSLDAEGSR